MLTPNQSTWLTSFRADALAFFGDPFTATLATAIAALESGWGDHIPRDADFINEIGYDAVQGRPKFTAIQASDRKAHEYRAFSKRSEELAALQYLFFQSSHYTHARASFATSVYATYSGLSCLTNFVRVFNQIANDNWSPKVYPIPDNQLLQKRTDKLSWLL